MNLKGANPASASRLEYSLPTAAHVNLSIFDVQGRNVRTLIDQDAAAGSFTARWDGTTETGLQAKKGVYFARLNAGGKSTEKKVVLQ